MSIVLDENDGFESNLSEQSDDDALNSIVSSDHDRSNRWLWFSLNELDRSMSSIEGDAQERVVLLDDHSRDLSA